MTSSERAAEIPESDYEQAEEAFVESLGSNFDTAKIIDEKPPAQDVDQVPLAAEKSSFLQTMRHIGTRDRRVAALLAFALGMFGLHKFYMGYHVQGFILLAISAFGGAFTFGVAILITWIIAISEGVSYSSYDQKEFERIYVDGRRDWF